MGLQLTQAKPSIKLIFFFLKPETRQFKMNLFLSIMLDQIFHLKIQTFHFQILHNLINHLSSLATF